MRKIRATINVELEYDNELLNYDHKLQTELKRVLTSNHICCKIAAGNLDNSKDPVIDDTNQYNTDRRIS